MYDWISRVSAAISEPFFNLFFGTEWPVLGALLLGIVGSLAPCQLTGNTAALAYTTKRYQYKKSVMAELVAFISGKMVVYFGIGLIAIVLGSQLEQQLIPVFVWVRKLIGPVLLLTGLVLVGWLRFRTLNAKLSSRIQNWAERYGGGKAAFGMGVGFSLGFCPTMAILFFGWLLPMVISTPFGWGLPLLFAIGTVVPLVVLILIASITGIDRPLLRQSRKVGRWATVGIGVVLIAIGVFDTITYWTL